MACDAPVFGAQVEIKGVVELFPGSDEAAEMHTPAP